MRVPSVTKTALTVLLTVMLTAVGSWANPASPPAPEMVLQETAHSFEPVVDGTTVRHDFVVRNEGDAVLKIHKVKTG